MTTPQAAAELYDMMVEDYERIIHQRDEAFVKLQEEIEYTRTLTAANAWRSCKCEMTQQRMPCANY